jgi:hypothetical protein
MKILMIKLTETCRWSSTLKRIKTRKIKFAYQTLTDVEPMQSNNLGSFKANVIVKNLIIMTCQMISNVRWV